MDCQNGLAPFDKEIAQVVAQQLAVARRQKAADKPHADDDNVVILWDRHDTFLLLHCLLRAFTG